MTSIGRVVITRVTVIAVLFFSANIAAASEKSHQDWLRFNPPIGEGWTVETAGGASNETQISRVAGKGPVRKVFVLYSGSSPSFDIAISKILTIFGQMEINAEFTIVNIHDDLPLAGKAMQRAESDDNELVFSMGSIATAHLWRIYRGGRLPVVSVGAKDPVVLGLAESYDKGTGTNFAFTSMNMPVEVQFAYIQDFMPSLRYFAILVDNTDMSTVVTQARPMAQLASDRLLNVLTIGVDEPEKIREELAIKVSDAVAQMRKSDPLLERSMFWITDSPAVIAEIATINRHSDRVPVTSSAPEAVRAGPDSAVMAIGICPGSNAHLAAIYGSDILSGIVKAGELPVGIMSPPNVSVNYMRSNKINFIMPFHSIKQIYGKMIGIDGKIVHQGSDNADGC